MKQLLSILCLFTFFENGYTGPELYNLHIRVVDYDTMEPVQGAKVSVNFSPGGSLGGASVGKEATTDSEGKVTISGKSIFEMAVGAKKDGWYWSRTTVANRKDDGSGLYRAQKSQHIELPIRRIKTPGAMYAKTVELSMPILSEKVGFDFKAGDWVVPHGSGKKAMIWFKMDRQVDSQDDYTQTLEVSFPNEEDGIANVGDQEGFRKSEFRWPYVAPTTNFDKTKTFTRSRAAELGLVEKPVDKKYILRVNTIRDNHGKLTSLNFVRLEKGMRLYGVLSENPGLKFTYYYNPKANDRNLEFDPSMNLFSNLPHSQRIDIP